MQVIKNWKMDFYSVTIFRLFSIHGQIRYNVMFIIYLATLVHIPESKFGFLSIGLRVGGGLLSRNHEGPFQIIRITKTIFHFYDFFNTPDNMTTACWKKVENDSNEAESKCFIF